MESRKRPPPTTGSYDEEGFAEITASAFEEGRRKRKTRPSFQAVPLQNSSSARPAKQPRWSEGSDMEVLSYLGLRRPGTVPRAVPGSPSPLEDASPGGVIESRQSTNGFQDTLDRRPVTSMQQGDEQSLERSSPLMPGTRLQQAGSRLEHAREHSRRGEVIHAQYRPNHAASDPPGAFSAAGAPSSPWRLPLFGTMRSGSNDVLERAGSGSGSGADHPTNVTPRENRETTARGRSSLTACPRRLFLHAAGRSLQSRSETGLSSQAPRSPVSPAVQSLYSSTSSAVTSNSFHTARSNVYCARDEVDQDYQLALRLQEEEDTLSQDIQGDMWLAQQLEQRLAQEETGLDAAVAAEMQEKEEEDRLRASMPQERECSICITDKHPLEFPARPPTLLCEHKVNTCTDCLEKWVESDLQQRGWERVSCPECRRCLSHSDMRRAATAETFARFDQLSARGALGTINNFVWCIGPDCGSGQLHEGNEDGTNPEMTCASCGFHLCVRHKIKWHAGETCAQYEYRTSGRRREDADSEDVIGRTTQQCPNERCGARVQKSVGCDHMTCSRCRAEFCYACGANYVDLRREGQMAHREGCKYRGRYRYPH